MKNDSLPRILLAVEASVQKVLIRLVIRAVFLDTFLLPIFKALIVIAFDKRNLSVYETLDTLFTLFSSIGNILHVGVLMEYEFPVRVVIVIEIYIVHIKFEIDHIVASVVAKNAWLRFHVSILLSVG